MKKLFIGLGIVVVLLGGGAFFLISNLDGLVKTAIETYGTDAVGSEVSVGSVVINLTEGSAAIYDFSVANPEGFSDQTMMSFSEVSVSIDIATIRNPLIVINSIVAREPYVLYESANGTTNVDAVSSRFEGDEESEPESSSTEDSSIELSITSILIENIEAQMAGEGVPDLTINLGDISLESIQGTPEEIASQIMGPVTRQISVNAAGALLEATADMITDSVEGVVEGLGDGLEGVGDALEEGLGNLFGN